MGRAKATCVDETSDLLFHHVIGKLGATERRQVEEHLESCPTCREHLEFLQWLRRQVAAGGSALFAGHATTEELLRYCDERESLTAAATASIETHLRLCRSCGSELEMLRAVDASLEEVETQVGSTEAASEASVAQPAGATTRPPLRERSLQERSLQERRRQQSPPWWQALADRFGAPFRALSGLSPVPAYVALAVLLVPAVIGLQEMTGGGGPLDGGVPATSGAPPVTVSAPIILPGSTQRGATQIPLLHPSPRGEVTVLLRAPVAGAPVLRYDCELLAGGGGVVWRSEDLHSRDAIGTFVLTLDAARLAAGRYRVELHEIHRQTGETVNTFVFPFQLASAPR